MQFLRLFILAFLLFASSAGAVEFAKEEVAVPDGTMEAQSGFAIPVHTSSESVYPDLPIEGAIPSPLSVKFLFEHRSALNAKTVIVQGQVMSVLLPQDACPSGSGEGKGPSPMMCAQPHIVIGDDVNSNYKLRVLLNESDRTPYTQGQIYSITGIVSSSARGAVLRKSD